MSQDRRSRRPARSGIRPACERLESRSLLSRAIPTPPVYVAMIAPSQFFLQQSGEALITLERTSNKDQELSVEFSTNPPTNPVNVPGKPAAVAATAGEQYLSVDEIVTFQPGQATLTVSVPIVREADNPGVVLVGMTVQPLMANASISTADIAVLSGPDQLPLAINDARMIREASGASAITMTFSQPMARASVENLGAYRVARAGRSGASVPLRSATYDDATATVTLVTKTPLNSAWMYEVVIGSNPKPARRGRPTPVTGVVPTSQTGNPLTFAQPLPGRPGTTPVVLSNKIFSGYVASPTSFNVSKRSSGPPLLNPFINIKIHYPFGYLLAHALIPI